MNSLLGLCPYPIGFMHAIIIMSARQTVYRADCEMYDLGLFRKAVPKVWYRKTDNRNLW